MPLPVNASAMGEVEALLTKEALADAAPLLCGVKVTVNDLLWPAAMVKGKASPLRANSEVLTEAEETVTLEPEALRVPVKLLLAPTTKLPKPKVAGVTVNWPAAVPVPEREMVRVELEALETTATLPLTLLADVGVKTTLKVTLSPAVKVSGRLRPLRLNADPVRLA